MASAAVLRQRPRGKEQQQRQQEEAATTTFPFTHPKLVEDKEDDEQMREEFGGKSLLACWLLLCVSASWAALYSPVGDCDETFNYWEPTHYLMFGSGLQTWEYSSAYALRSYLYIGIHALWGRLLIWIAASLSLPLSKIALFYSLRLSLGLLCTTSLTLLVRSIARRYDREVAHYTILFLFLSPGIVLSSTSYLPQTFTMICTSLSFAYWIDERRSPFLPIFFMAMAGLIGWPFVGVLALPMAKDLLYRHGLVSVLRSASLSAALCLLPSVLVDYYYYHKLVIAVVSIMVYNVFTSHGANLYGVEPWHFFLRNLALNLNVVLPLALLALPLALLLLFLAPRKDHNAKLTTRVLKHLSIAFGFIVLFSLMAHKEERFLYPVYPLLCISAAVSLHLLPLLHQSLRSLRIPVVVVFVALSISRLAAISQHYSAPLQVYSHLPAGQDVVVCVGKEWYRYPSSFFLPTSASSLQFLRSDFDGLLPKAFASVGGTWKEPTHMNDRNEREEDRYVDEQTCDFIVDLDLNDQKEPHYHSSDQWQVVFETPFLDAANSRSPFRAFWAPLLTPLNVRYRPYQLLRRSSE